MTELVGTVFGDSAVLDMGPVEALDIGGRILGTVDLDSDTFKRRHDGMEGVVFEKLR